MKKKFDLKTGIVIWLIAAPIAVLISLSYEYEVFRSDYHWSERLIVAILVGLAVGYGGSRLLLGRGDKK